MRSLQRVSSVILSAKQIMYDKCEVLHDRKLLEEIAPLTERDYYVRGCTALLDAIGGAIHHIGNVHKYARAEDRPEKTLFIITTDGMENASKQYGYEKVKRMIERQKERYGWEFLFLGANMDAISVAGRFGIASERAVRFHSDEKGTEINYRVLSETIAKVRCGAPMPVSWKEEIEADYEARK